MGLVFITRCRGSNEILFSGVGARVRIFMRLVRRLLLLEFRVRRVTHGGGVSAASSWTHCGNIVVLPRHVLVICSAMRRVGGRCCS